MIIMVIGVGTNVPFDFRGLPTCGHLLNFPMAGLIFYLAVSGDGYTQSFTYIFMDLTPFSNDIMMD